MTALSLIVPLIALLVIQTHGFIHVKHPNVPHFLLGRPPGGFLEGGYHNAMGDKIELSATYPNVQEFYINQKLDHFNDSISRTWKQRVQSNMVYAKNELVFVMIGGESKISEKWVGNEEVQMVKWAKKFGAAIYQLEHRFFGYSRPLPTMSTEALAYCTTEQALADLAEFIQQMNNKNGYKNPRWVTFGGSYPGSLSAWFREKYPKLTVGAVASSAPVNLKLDFYEYSLVVDNVLKETDATCHNRVQIAMKQIEKLLLTTEGRQQINVALSLDPPFDDKYLTPQAVQFFISNVYDMFQGVVQYTYDGGSNTTMHGLTVRNLCAAINKAPVDKPLAQIRSVMDFINSYYPSSGCQNDPSKCKLANSYDAMIDVYSNATYDESTDNAAWRGWMWLCCNEIGFLQTLDGGRNVFGSLVPLNLYIDMCTDMFGRSVTMDTITRRNANAQRYYGGADNYKTTNVILPNGSLDPWHALGMYNEDSATHQKPLLIQGTAHCADMYPAYVGEPAGLAPARAEIEAQLGYYIQQTPPK